MSEQPTGSSESASIESGTVVYDSDGNKLGVIVGMTGEGFEVAIDDEFEGVNEDGTVEGELSVDDESTSTEELQESERESKPGKEFGEGYLMWRCNECGEMGELEDGLPTECPNCGSENVTKWRED